MNVTLPLFDAGELADRAAVRSARVTVSVADDAVTGVGGLVLWGPLLDKLNLVGVADERGLRPIGPGGYTGGECYRTLVETLLAGGDFVSDRSLLAGASQRLRGDHRLPSTSTVWRFGAGADLGRVAKAGAVNRTMLARAWAMGAGPSGSTITIDPDATGVATYGPDKEGSTFGYGGKVGMSPLVGVCGETGDVLAMRARGGDAHPGRAKGSFVDECVSAIPPAVRIGRRLWIRVDSAGYRTDVIESAERHRSVFTITAPKKPNVKAAISALHTHPDTVWASAVNCDIAGSQIAETTLVFNASKPDQSRTLRLIVRRQPLSANEQASIDDLDGWRFHAIITNIARPVETGRRIEAHHRLRGGIPEDTIRQLKEDFGMNHAPFSNFFANWLWWHGCALAHNVANWIKRLALPTEFARCRGKRLRLAFFNIAGRLVTHARQLRLRISKHHPWGAAFIEALTRIQQLPTYA